MSATSASASASAFVPSPAVIDTMVRIILSQTEMTEEEIKTALEQTNYDLKRVIREYMSGTDTAVSVAPTTTAANSTNQLRFSEIRNFMDKSDQQYYRRQEMQKIYNDVLERKKAAAAAAAEASATETHTPTSDALPSKL
jgi:uncharacterized protein YchJ